MTGGSFFGIKWIFWGPYYYITRAPLLTRIWESKKFLKDLAEVENDADFDWPDNNSCTQVGSTYLNNCNSQTFRKHPVRDKLGDGLDWLIRHTIGKHFGGVLGSSNCEDQSTTIANQCAFDRVTALWAAYNGFCDMYPSLIYHRATDINWPNTVSLNSGYLAQFNEYEKAAYKTYYDTYTAIYDIGSTIFTGHGTPENLNPAYDTYAYYCYNANYLFNTGAYGHNMIYTGATPSFTPPTWYPIRGDLESVTPFTQEYKDYQQYFQNNYRQHVFDV